MARRGVESLAAIGSEVHARLRAGRTAEAFRVAANWYTGARSSPSDELENALRDEPQAMEDPRWDALLAGLAEQLTLERGVACPRWALEPRRYLPTWWFVSPYASVHPSAFVEAPKALANRGVFVHRDDLMSL